MSVAVIILLVLTYILNLIDYFQTTYAISLVGIDIEANPLARFCFKYHVAWAHKVLVTPILFAIMGFLIITMDIRQIWLPCVLFALYSFVVVHNFGVIKKIHVYLKNQTQS